MPPLLFRFQFNPEVLSDKKSYRYKTDSFGEWSLDNFQSAGGSLLSISGLQGLLKDTKEIGSRLINTKPLDAEEGEPRQITLEFKLDGTRPGPLDDNDHYGGSILPDIHTLRAFMAPSLDLPDLIGVIANRKMDCFKRPPECSVSYGHVSMTGVMTDLDIRVVQFYEDGDPMRAEVTATIKEQSRSIYPIIDSITRTYYVGRGYARAGFGLDIVDAVLPTFVTNMFLPR